MESVTTTQKRVQRSESEIRALLTEQQQSAVTVKQFCSLHNIHEQTFYNWRKKFNLKTDNLPPFIPLQIAPSDNSLFAEIELSDKVSIRLFRQVDPSYFKALL